MFAKGIFMFIKNVDAGNKRYLMLAESMTLLVLLILSFLCVGPLLEEWGLFNAFNKEGLGHLKSFAPHIPLRPLHLTSSALQWLLGNGHPIGVAIVAGLFFLARYFIVRWAVSPLLTGYSRWSVSTLAAVLVAWPGIWLGRYLSAQLSAILFFAALGLCIRLARKFSPIQIIACSGLVVLMSMNYQGLTLCLLAMPVASLFWYANCEGENFKRRSIKDSSIISIFFAIVFGFVIYGIYAVLISKFMHGGGYEGQLLGSGETLLTLKGLLSHIKGSYITAYLQNTLIFPFFLSISCLFLFNSGTLAAPVKTRLFLALLLFVSILLLPLLSLIYVSSLHIHDTDRVLFPVSVGFVLICITVTLAVQKTPKVDSNPLLALLIVVTLISSAGLSAIKIKQYTDLQRTVISQTLDFIKRDNPQSVVISDSTGTLGDVYTLLEEGTLSSALAFYGKPMSAIICTPMGVDRIHPVAQRFPIPSTKRCEELPPAPAGQLLLHAQMVNGKITISP
jgi:hypothetical protein